MDDATAKKKLLFDIRTCIQHIENYVGNPRIFEDYDRNPLVQDAVERNLITIGEAVNTTRLFQFPVHEE